MTADPTHDANPLPEPLGIELEFTSSCNARCTACPRTDMPKPGLLKVQTLDQILDLYSEVRHDFAANKRIGRTAFPRVSVAGGGEPLIHPDAIELFERIHRRDYQIDLTTNGSKLRRETIDFIAKSGCIESVTVSFWGVSELEYEAAMRLPYHDTLRKVEELADALRRHRSSTSLRISWVRTAEISSSDVAIASFWESRGIAVKMGRNHQWNRGGLHHTSSNSEDGAPLDRPNPADDIWCTELYFDDNYRWDGECVLCCCNYFTSEPISFGHVSELTFELLARRKLEMLRRRPLPSMCQVCEIPRDPIAVTPSPAWFPAVAAETIQAALPADTNTRLRRLPVL